MTAEWRPRPTGSPSPGPRSRWDRFDGDGLALAAPACGEEQADAAHGGGAQQLPPRDRARRRIEVAVVRPLIHRPRAYDRPQVDGERPPLVGPWPPRPRDYSTLVSFFGSALDRSEGCPEPPHPVRESLLGFERGRVFSGTALEAMSPGRGVRQRSDLPPDLVHRLGHPARVGFPDGPRPNRAHRSAGGLRMKTRKGG